MSITPTDINAQGYAGPFFQLTGPDSLFLGDQIQLLRNACSSYYSSNITDYAESVSLVPECIFGNSSERMKANMARHQYLLTLWPAFISIIVAMYPDAAPVAFDNLAWSSLLALTSGGMVLPLDSY